MKSTHLSLGKQKLTNWMLVVFTLVIAVMALYTEIFQKRAIDIDYSNIYTNPFSEIFIKTATQIEIINRMGDFKLQKMQTNWSLTHPRKLPANRRQINEMLSSLRKILIKRVYPKDKINIQNFSLNNPLAKINLTSDINSITMEIGLINPINQSAYITFSNIDKIFQINIINYSFESAVIADLIDTGVFSFETANLEQIKIFRGLQKAPFFNIKKMGKIWSDNKNKLLDPDKVQQLITSLRALKSSIILDSISDKSQELLNRAFTRPMYVIELKEFDHKYKITVSNILYRTADLKIEKKNYVAIKTSDKDYPILLPKDYLYLFNQRHSKLRKK
jgi:hypothetical protein